MQSKFFAFMARMKYINRWGLMRNTYTENIAEHSLVVSLIAHCLAVMENKLNGGSFNPDRIGMIAAYHETGEIITGDLPTPIKYYSPELRANYKAVEEEATGKILATLPDYLRDEITALVIPTKEEERIVKYADKLAAYIKCIEETACGNNEFVQAQKTIHKALEDYRSPSVNEFLKTFVPAFTLSLDDLANN